MPPSKQCSKSLFLLSTYQAFEDIFSPYCYHVVSCHTFFYVFPSTTACKLHEEKRQSLSASGLSSLTYRSFPDGPTRPTRHTRRFQKSRYQGFFLPHRLGPLESSGPPSSFCLPVRTHSREGTWPFPPRFTAAVLKRFGHLSRLADSVTATCIPEMG